MSESRTCTRCGHEDLTEACPTCTAEWENRRDVETMTPEERLAEFRSWCGVLEIDWPKVHERIEELVGRPVYHGGGPAFGSQRHGWGLNGEVVEWKTPWERVAERVTSLAASDRKKRERLENTRADLLRDYAELPEPLRHRLDRFAAERADFWVDSGSYELFCCKEAAKIAGYLRPRVEAGEDAETVVREFHDLPWDEQVKAGVDEGHSGNTFGGACSLARALLTGQPV